MHISSVSAGREKKKQNQPKCSFQNQPNTHMNQHVKLPLASSWLRILRQRRKLFFPQPFFSPKLSFCKTSTVSTLQK